MVFRSFSTPSVRKYERRVSHLSINVDFICGREARSPLNAILYKYALTTEYISGIGFNLDGIISLYQPIGHVAVAALVPDK